MLARSPRPLDADPAIAPLLFLGQTPPPLESPGYRVVDLHVDHLGSVRLATDELGQVTARHDFLPFGEEILPIADASTKMFTGHERDLETGLDYMMARYYSNSVARFASVDPTRRSVRPTMPPTWNRYTYAGSNPVGFVDRNGQEAMTATLTLTGAGSSAAAGAGAAAGATAGVGFLGGWLIGRGIGHIPISAERTIDDLVTDAWSWLLFAKGGKQNVRDSGLEGLSEAELLQLLEQAKKAGDTELALRIIRHLKALGKRNIQKRKEQDVVPPAPETDDEPEDTEDEDSEDGEEEGDEDEKGDGDEDPEEKDDEDKDDKRSTGARRVRRIAA